eukprot:TRINITY_DN6785_c0_g1_i1.p1 TRINITY_DN6785_c0_g1~~TRINITY_DN6785_c0_g1_i1.p1  ORF type:complete len:181 (-),score=43.59 TRINITY_DN6785_c0_g1_i1:167-655(-)
MTSALTIAAFVVTPVIGGFAGSILTAKAIKTWYKEIRKPSFNPPNWIFGPVWTILYCAMGYSSYLIWSKGGLETPATRAALGLYATQLALNWAWTPFFFGMKNFGLALVDILALGSSVSGCIYLFHPISPLASYLLVPYLGWVSFASLLNFEIWRLNRKEKK